MKRSFYASLSADNRSELDRKLIDGGWSGYAQIREWLATQGCAVSETVVKRYGDRHRARLESAKFESDYRRAYGDELASEIEAGSVSLIATAQRASQHMANVLERKMREYDESGIPVPQDLLNAATALSKTVSAIGALNNTQVVARKFAAELKAKQEAKLSELQADGAKQGITIEFMNRIRTEVLGLE